MRRARYGFLLALAILALGFGGTLAATERYTLPGDTVFPEGIAAGTLPGEYFVGSTTSGAVYRGTTNAPSAEPFLPPGLDGRTDVRGLKVDSRGRLYLAGGATGQLFVYDGQSRGLIAKFATGLTPTFVNDVTIAPNGDAYFTDSNSPAIYRVAADVTAPGAFSRWSDLAGSPIIYGQGFNLNGIAASGDGKYLVVVQSNTGKLFRIEIATRAITEIDLGGQTVMGGDGLLLDKQNLWVMRNAAATLVTFQLSTDFSSARLITTTTDPDFDFPTTFARLGDKFLVVNSQLNKRIANQPPTLPFVVVGLPVPGSTSSPVPVVSPTAPSAATPTIPSTATPLTSPPPTVIPTPSVVVQPTPPATGSGGNLPGLPNTGDGGGGLAAPLTLAVALATAVGLGAIGLARRRGRRA
jgi:Cu-Zn family superoxide dismutase